MTDEIRAELAALRQSHADLQADHKALLLQSDFIVRALSMLITRHFDMSNKDDFLAQQAANDAALTANDTLLAGLVRGAGTLISAHGDSDAVFADALAKAKATGDHIATQGKAITVLGNAITAALPADTTSAAASTDAGSAPVAAAASDSAPADAVSAQTIPVAPAAPVVIPAPAG